MYSIRHHIEYKFENQSINASKIFCHFANPKSQNAKTVLANGALTNLMMMNKSIS